MSNYYKFQGEQVLTPIKTKIGVQSNMCGRNLAMSTIYIFDEFLSIQSYFTFKRNKRYKAFSNTYQNKSKKIKQ